LTEYLQNYSIKTRPDWLETDTNSITYIENKPFGVKYETLSIPSNIFLNTEFRGNLSEDGLGVLSRYINTNNNYIFNPYDIFEFSFNQKIYQEALKEIEFEGVKVYYLGNANLFSQIIDKELLENLIPTSTTSTENFLFYFI
jgi:hypothetical protein